MLTIIACGRALENAGAHTTPQQHSNGKSPPYRVKLWSALKGQAVGAAPSPTRAALMSDMVPNLLIKARNARTSAPRPPKPGTCRRKPSLSLPSSSLPHPCDCTQCEHADRERTGGEWTDCEHTNWMHCECTLWYGGHCHRHYHSIRSTSPALLCQHLRRNATCPCQPNPTPTPVTSSSSG